jgi:hypothetical protein
LSLNNLSFGAGAAAVCLIVRVPIAFSNIPLRHVAENVAMGDGRGDVFIFGELTSGAGFVMQGAATLQKNAKKAHSLGKAAGIG